MRSKLVVALVLVALATLPAGQLSASDQPTFKVIGTFTLPVGGEVMDGSPNGRYLAVTDSGLQKAGLVDLQDPSAPTQLCEFALPAGANPTSAAIHPSGSYVVVTVKSDPNPGKALAFSIPDCALLWQVPVGIGPDLLQITSNGQQAVVAIEDEETEVGQPASCPAGNVRPGRVDIIDLPKGANDTASVTSVPISLTGVAGVNCPTDPQPEGVAVSPNSKLAYVTLEENNALATIDIDGAAVLSITAMGTTSHLADTTQDGTATVDDPFTGRREPDGIAVSKNGKFVFTADEGDTSRTGSCNAAGTVYSGGRTMTVLSAAKLTGNDFEPPAIVGDTGSQMEGAAAAAGALPDGRGYATEGPEPEMVTTFHTAGGEYAAVSLERSNGVLIFDISDPEHPVAETFIPTGSRRRGRHLPARLPLAGRGERSCHVANSNLRRRRSSLLSLTSADELSTKGRPDRGAPSSIQNLRSFATYLRHLR